MANVLDNLSIVITGFDAVMC